MQRKAAAISSLFGFVNPPHSISENRQQICLKYFEEILSKNRYFVFAELGRTQIFKLPQPFQAVKENHLRHGTTVGGDRIGWLFVGGPRYRAPHSADDYLHLKGYFVKSSLLTKLMCIVVYQEQTNGQKRKSVLSLSLLLTDHFLHGQIVYKYKYIYVYIQIKNKYKHKCK